MDYYQDVVAEYLRADRCVFINHEFTIQLDEGVAQPEKERSWICDLVSVHFRKKTVFLCEVTYSRSLSALIKRLKSWSQNWPDIVRALQRDTCISADFKVRPWIFIPESLTEAFVKKFHASGAKFETPPLITTLEMTVPWRHRTWDRRGENNKPDVIPPDMRE